VGLVVRRFEIWLVSLDPAVGSEMQKPRPAVVVSPDEMNNRLNTVLVAPLTKGGFAAPFRVSCHFAGINGQIALDHIRSVDKRRLKRQLGQLDPATAKTVLTTLRELFEE
jgi:mRNA interferase MazF